MKKRKTKTKIKEKNYKKRMIVMLVVSGALTLFLSLLLILRTSPAVSEWMAANISRGWISVFSVITGILPFSLYETTLYVAILGGAAAIITAIVFFCKKKASRAATYLLLVAVVGMSVGNVYMLSAGFAYNREEPDLPSLGIERLTSSDASEIASIASFMIDDMNALADEMERDDRQGCVSPYTFKELAKKMQVEYERLDSDYFSDFTPLAKPVTSKWIMSNMQLSGVFFAPYGEANVNPLTPPCELPVTMAHELAHAKGAMRESDANLTAYWLTLSSDDPYLRYCGYMGVYKVVLNILSVFDAPYARTLSEKVDARITRDKELSAEFWNEYTLFDDISEAFNDFYLKLSGQSGVSSYSEPTKPPFVENVPSEGGVKPEVVYELNSLQKTVLFVIKDRADGKDDEN